MEDVGLDDVELVQISTKELNRHLKKKNIDKPRQKEVKARRRTLKNRSVAVLNLCRRNIELDWARNFWAPGFRFRARQI